MSTAKIKSRSCRIILLKFWNGIVVGLEFYTKIRILKALLRDFQMKNYYIYKYIEREREIDKEVGRERDWFQVLVSDKDSLKYVL